jgi:hypothetical protein
MRSSAVTTILLTLALFSAHTSSALDYYDLEEVVTRAQEQRQEETFPESTSKIRMDVENQIILDTTNRYLQGVDDTECYSVQSDKENRYCIVDDTPRNDTFLILACPSFSQGGYSECACTIGIGDPDQAPNTETCSRCSFCKDSTLAYDCRNVAEGTCIGFNCRGECISSFEAEEALEEDSATSRQITWVKLWAIACIVVAAY